MLIRKEYTKNEEIMTPNKEDYIKKIYELGGDQSLISNKQISEGLNISPSSVTEMLRKLTDEALISYTAYKGSKLTTKGLQIALSMIRRHRLWEVFLIEHLGYSWSEAHEDAEQLEHITPTRLENRLDSFLNHPSECPHGSVIPEANKRPTRKNYELLADLPVGSDGIIRKVHEEKALLDYLENIGIEIGLIFKITKIGEYEGQITLQTGHNKTISISNKGAKGVYIERRSK